MIPVTPHPADLRVGGDHGAAPTGKALGYAVLRGPRAEVVREDLGGRVRVLVPCFYLPTRRSLEPHTRVPVKEWLLARGEGLQ